jgi:hypothetical protein
MNLCAPSDKGKDFRMVEVMPKELTGEVALVTGAAEESAQRSPGG